MTICSDEGTGAHGRVRRPSQVPPLLKFENIPWVVYVTREEAPIALDVIEDRYEMEVFEEQLAAGEITEEEFHEAIGP
ncbi:hypothetical protein [Nonomuraea jabiensis]|uniref:hypothetical protein n=1 Tax=Nonomuraea jabiensis TaxID=882448 RepID=UPI003D72C982